MPFNKILVAYYTMIRREFVRIIRIWSQTLLPPVVTMSLYFIIFGGFIGSQIGDIHGFSYMQFIVPGLVMMAIITSAYMNTVSTFYFAKWVRTIDEVLVSPMPNWVVMAGFVSGGILRAGLVGILVTVTSLFFTHLALVNIFIVFFAAFLTALVFSLAGLVNGFYAKSFDAISIVPTFVLTPLTYLGGVFYSIDQLPPFWGAVSQFNPILYMVNAFRYGFLGVSDVNVMLSFGILIGLTVVLMALVLWLFKRGVGLKN
ncbi:MAG: ABC transporter permease [Candidatus Pacebacteria bacterium]|nr:ABC transporter permease [Candidatus Paceibacterota bacterium]MBP9840650.1 ABC transporter permease [Candidatus Paceibacterota bacterium]